MRFTVELKRWMTMAQTATTTVEAPSRELVESTNWATELEMKWENEGNDRWEDEPLSASFEDEITMEIVEDTNPIGVPDVEIPVSNPILPGKFPVSALRAVLDYTKDDEEDSYIAADMQKLKDWLKANPG